MSPQAEESGSVTCPCSEVVHTRIPSVVFSEEGFSEPGREYLPYFEEGLSFVTLAGFQGSS